jgi:uncharacterized protein Yka (UPF0111/DUF47 family)
MTDQKKIEGLLADCLAEIEEARDRIAVLEAEADRYRRQLKPSA